MNEWKESQAYQGEGQNWNQQGNYYSGDTMYDRYHIPPEQLNLPPYRKSYAKVIVVVMSVIFFLFVIVSIVFFGQISYRLVTDPLYRYEFEREHADSEFWRVFIEELDKTENYDDYDYDYHYDYNYDFDEDSFFPSNDIDV